MELAIPQTILIYQDKHKANQSIEVKENEKTTESSKI
jgi:hypothetical protein